MPPLAALLLDWAVTAAWPLIGRSGIRLYSSTLFNFAGLAIGLVLLLPWILSRGRWRRILSRELAPALAGMGFFSGMANLIYIAAVGYTTPANAAIMAQVEVLYSALLCAWLLKEPITLRQSAASLLIVAGTGLIMLHDLSTPRWRGDLMILATPWMYQVSHIFSKRLPKDLDPVSISAGRILYGLAALSPLCLWTLWRGPRWTWSPEGLSILFVQGLAMSCLNFVLWYMAILRMDLAKATAIMLSYPALTLVLSWALGQETIRGIQLAGLAVTFIGASWVSRLVLSAQGSLPASQRLPPEAAAEI